jgi:hypothetical protein
MRAATRGAGSFVARAAVIGALGREGLHPSGPGSSAQVQAPAAKHNQRHFGDDVAAGFAKRPPTPGASR